MAPRCSAGDMLTLSRNTVVILFMVITLSIALQISDFKSCADADCKNPISEARALGKHHPRDPRFLHFNAEDTIIIFSKNAGKRQDLWGGEVSGKAGLRGYFPKNFVQELKLYEPQPKHVVPTLNDPVPTMDDRIYETSSSHSIPQRQLLPQGHQPPVSHEQQSLIDQQHSLDQTGADTIEIKEDHKNTELSDGTGDEFIDMNYKPIIEVVPDVADQDGIFNHNLPDITNDPGKVTEQQDSFNESDDLKIEELEYLVDVDSKDDLNIEELEDLVDVEPKGDLNIDELEDLVDVEPKDDLNIDELEDLVDVEPKDDLNIEELEDLVDVEPKDDLNIEELEDLVDVEPKDDFNIDELEDLVDVEPEDDLKIEELEDLVDVEPKDDLNIDELEDLVDVEPEDYLNIEELEDLVDVEPKYDLKIEELEDLVDVEPKDDLKIEELEDLVDVELKDDLKIEELEDLVDVEPKDDLNIDELEYLVDVEPKDDLNIDELEDLVDVVPKNDLKIEELEDLVDVVPKDDFKIEELQDLVDEEPKDDLNIEQQADLVDVVPKDDLKIEELEDLVDIVPKDDLKIEELQDDEKDDMYNVEVTNQDLSDSLEVEEHDFDDFHFDNDVITGDDGNYKITRDQEPNESLHKSTHFNRVGETDAGLSEFSVQDAFSEEIMEVKVDDENVVHEPQNNGNPNIDELDELLKDMEEEEKQSWNEEDNIKFSHVNQNEDLLANEDEDTEFDTNEDEFTEFDTNEDEEEDLDSDEDIDPEEDEEYNEGETDDFEDEQENIGRQLESVTVAGDVHVDSSVDTVITADHKKKDGSEQKLENVSKEEQEEIKREILRLKEKHAAAKREDEKKRKELEKKMEELKAEYVAFKKEQEEKEEDDDEKEENIGDNKSQEIEEITGNPNHDRNDVKSWSGDVMKDEIRKKMEEMKEEYDAYLKDDQKTKMSRGDKKQVDEVTKETIELNGRDEVIDLISDILDEDQYEVIDGTTIYFEDLGYASDVLTTEDAMVTASTIDITQSAGDVLHTLRESLHPTAVETILLQNSLSDVHTTSDVLQPSEVVFKSNTHEATESLHNPVSSVVEVVDATHVQIDTETDTIQDFLSHQEEFNELSKVESWDHIEPLDEVDENHVIDEDTTTPSYRIDELIALPPTAYPDYAEDNIEAGRRKLRVDWEKDFDTDDTIAEDSGTSSGKINVPLYNTWFDDYIDITNLIIEPLLLMMPESMRMSLQGEDFYGIPWAGVFITLMIGILTFGLLICKCAYGLSGKKMVDPEVVEKQLRQQVQVLKDEKEDIQNSLVNVERQVHSLRSDLENKVLCIADLSDAKQNLEKSYHEVESRNVELNDKIQQLQSNYVQQAESLDEQRKLVTMYQDQSCESMANVTILQHKIQELESSYNDSNTLLTQLQTELDSSKEQSSILELTKEQLLKEAQGWTERVDEMNERIVSLTNEKKQLDETLEYKNNELEVLKDCLLQLKSLETMDADDDENSGLNIEDKIKHMLDVSKVNAKLSIIEEERNSLESRLQSEITSRIQLEDQIAILNRQVESLGKEHGEAEKQYSEAQTKLTILSEYFKEKELKMQRQIGIEEALKINSQTKLENVEKKAAASTEDAINYRKQLQDLRKELEEVERNFRTEVASYEKKAHESWLLARSSEREMNEAKRESATLRQRVTELEERIKTVSAASPVVKPSPALRSSSPHRMTSERPGPPRRASPRDNDMHPSPPYLDRDGGLPPPRGRMVHPRGIGPLLPHGNVTSSDIGPPLDRRGPRDIGDMAPPPFDMTMPPRLMGPPPKDLASHIGPPMPMDSPLPREFLRDSKRLSPPIRDYGPPQPGDMRLPPPSHMGLPREAGPFPPREFGPPPPPPHPDMLPSRRDHAPPPQMGRGPPLRRPQVRRSSRPSSRADVPPPPFRTSSPLDDPMLFSPGLVCPPPMHEGNIPPHEGHQPPTTSHQPPTTSHQPPTTSYQPPLSKTGFQPVHPNSQHRKSVPP